MYIICIYIYIYIYIYTNKSIYIISYVTRPAKIDHVSTKNADF